MKMNVCEAAVIGLLAVTGGMLAAALVFFGGVYVAENCPSGWSGIYSCAVLILNAAVAAKIWRG